MFAVSFNYPLAVIVCVFSVSNQRLLSTGPCRWRDRLQ